MIKKAVLFVTLVLLLVGCGGSGPKAKITSVETVDTINSNRSADSLKFVYDGEVLGEGSAGLDTVIKPD